MSGINITYDVSCKIGNGPSNVKTEELSFREDKLNMANIIAGEVVNEILENALDIATRASETGIHWKTIKAESEVNLIKSRSSADQEIIVASNFEKLKIDEPLPIDVEMKHLVSEMIYPPRDMIQCAEAQPVKGGVGDQLVDSVESCVISERNVTVEKKSRVTDLVKNSGQILTEYILNEEMRQNQDEWEETEEKIIQVIDLDSSNSGVKDQKEQLTSDDDDDFVKVPQDSSIMDLVDLSSKAFRGEERELSSEVKQNGGKGDEFCNYNMIVVMPPHEVEHVNGDERIIAEQNSPSKNEVKDTKAKKKKWNFGTKFMSFLKRHPKQDQHVESSK